MLGQQSLQGANGEGKDDIEVYKSCGVYEEPKRYALKLATTRLIKDFTPFRGRANTSNCLWDVVRVIVTPSATHDRKPDSTLAVSSPLAPLRFFFVFLSRLRVIPLPQVSIWLTTSFAVDVSLAPTEGGMGHEAARAATTCIRCCKARAHTHLPFLGVPSSAHCPLCPSSAHDNWRHGGCRRWVWVWEGGSPLPEKNSTPPPLPNFLKDDKKRKREKKGPPHPEREREEGNPNS